MGFIRRINSVFNYRAQENTKEYFIGALKRLNLAKNAFKSDFIFQDKNSSEYLALNNPAQFIYKYLNNDVIEHAMRLNTEIIRILKENKLSLNYDTENVSALIASHLVPTARMAHKIYYNIT